VTGPSIFMRWLEYLEEGLIVVLMGAMTLLTFAQVVARYVFNYSFVWALELTGVMFAWLIFIGMAYGVRVGAHIGIDAAVKALGERASRIVGCIALILCIVYALIVLWGGTSYVMTMYTVGIEMQDMPVPQWVPRLVLPLGYLMLTFRFAQALWDLAHGRHPAVLHDEVHDAMQLAQGEGMEVRE
jgi:C4-dicarboxylate transporter DctQ subunit